MIALSYILHYVPKPHMLSCNLGSSGRSCLMHSHMSSPLSDISRDWYHFCNGYNPYFGRILFSWVHFRYFIILYVTIMLVKSEYSTLNFVWLLHFQIKEERKMKIENKKKTEWSAAHFCIWQTRTLFIHFLSAELS